MIASRRFASCCLSLLLTISLTSSLSGADTPHWLQPFPGEPKDTTIAPPPRWKAVPKSNPLPLAFNPARLQNPVFQRDVLLNRESLASLPLVLASDPEMAAYWSNLQSVARHMLTSGRWTDLPDERTSRYTYQLAGRLPSLALLYAATGQPELGEMLHTLVLDTVRRPAPFWIHAELRPYDPTHTVGKIETGELTRAVALAQLWASDLFTDAERTEIREQLIRKGLDPCLRYVVEEKAGNNFVAVISGGAFVAARALGDEPAAALALSGLEAWLKLVENDGSYGEPEGYFGFGCSRFFMSWWALGREEGKARLQNQNLKNSLPFIAYHYVLRQNEETHKPQAWKVNFGDDDFDSTPAYLVCESLAYAYNQGLGIWLSREIGSTRGNLSMNEFLFRLSVPVGERPTATSPTDAKLPTAAKFDNGLAFIRSGWTFDRDIVFALKSGGSARTGYSHDHPNRNSFALFVDGDYLIAAPGRASYRNPLHIDWDARTTTANTFTFGGENQTRTRTAEITGFSDNATFSYLASEAAGSYKNKPKSVLRQVWFLKKEGWFVIADTIALKSPSPVEWSLLLANGDGKSVLTELDNGGWKLQRPATELSFWVQSDRPSTATSSPGYLHRDYSYFPGDPGEGKLGSATHLTWKTDQKTASLRVWTLLIPRSQLLPGLKVQFVPGTSDDPSVAWKIASGSSKQHLTLAPGKDPVLTHE